MDQAGRDCKSVLPDTCVSGGLVGTRVIQLGGQMPAASGCQYILYKVTSHNLLLSSLSQNTKHRMGTETELNFPPHVAVA